MATETITRILDDIDGTEGAATRVFSVGNRTWEIDLTDENYGKLFEAVADYMDAGRQIKGGEPVSKSQARANREWLAAIREWAKDNGHAISDRGRVPDAIQQAFRKAGEPGAPKRRSGASK